MNSWPVLGLRVRRVRVLAALALIGGAAAAPHGDATTSASCAARHQSQSWLTIDSPFTTPSTELTSPQMRSNFDSDGTMNLVAVDARDPSRIFATDGTQLDRSTDGGCTWASVYTTGVNGEDLPATYVISRIAIAGSGPGSHVYLLLQENSTSRNGSYETQVVASSNGGTSFTSHDLVTPSVSRPAPACLTSGSEDEYRANLVASPSSVSTVYMICDNGTSPMMFASTDSAATWTRVPSAGLPYWSTFSPLAVAPTSAKSVWLTGTNTASPFETAVWRSNDGGRTFDEVYVYPKSVTQASHKGEVGLQTFLPPRAKPAALQIIAVNEAGIALSLNAGKTWSLLSLPSTPPNQTGPILTAAIGPRPGEITAITGYGGSASYTSAYGPHATPSCGESTLAWSYSIPKKKWTSLAAPSITPTPGGYGIYGLLPSGAGNATGLYGLETGYSSPCASSVAIDSPHIVAYTGS